MTANLRAACWMVGAIASFSAMAIAARIVLGDLTPLQLMFYRNIIAVMVLIFCLPMIGLHRLKIQQPLTHVIRHSVHFFGQFAWFVAIALIPLAQVFALEFTVPIWAVLFAALLVNEQITRQRLWALLLGFAGTMVIVRPGLVAVETVTIVMLCGALAFGLVHTLTRKITQTDSPMSVLVLMNFLQLPMAAIAFSVDPLWPPSGQWPCLVSIALTALTAHYCLAKALSLAPANIVIPMDFLRLPLIAVLAWWIFQEPLEVWVFAGAALMLTGIWINLRPLQR
ncbi:MAG: drug/metabolite transporter (DMT)-like permease [Bacteroidia bacterium]|jgi:drug/metabolite transporter (DMT)-like permease